MVSRIKASPALPPDGQTRKKRKFRPETNRRIHLSINFAFRKYEKGHYNFEATPPRGPRRRKF